MRLLNLLKSKIHHAHVTEADLNYIGSITIDGDLIERSGMVVGELVHVWNVENGARFETYVIEGEPLSGKIIINGAAAHHVNVGDRVIVASFCLSDEPVQPEVILVDAQNRYLRNL